MFNYGLNKFDIEKINSKTYDLESGNYKKSIQFDSEIVSIFKKEGINFLAYDKDTIYLKLDLASDYLGKKITQEVIKVTKKRFQLQCPYCGEYFNNDTQILGIAKIDILNLNGIVVCKNCLDKI
jgi:formylmethanofuran dehydrogenase subunit E